MTISDDTLRFLAGERDRLTASRAIYLSERAMSDVSQASEMAAELLRYRSAERADKDRVRAVVWHAVRHYTEISDPVSGSIADRAADQLAPTPTPALAAIRERISRLASVADLPIDVKLELVAIESDLGSMLRRNR